MLEHVRAGGRVAGWLQDRTQPAWTWFTGGCHPNRDTEAAVAAAGFVIDPATHRAQGDMRRFVSRACRDPHEAREGSREPLREPLPKAHS